MTPEQLADQLAARQAGGLWYRSDDVTAELRRLSAENAELRKDAERWQQLAHMGVNKVDPEILADYAAELRRHQNAAMRKETP